MRRWRQKNRPITWPEAMFSAANRKAVPCPSPSPLASNSSRAKNHRPPLLARFVSAS